MMRSFLRFIKNIFYSIPFGLKGGDLVLSQKSSVNSDNTKIVNFTSNENLGEKLLKGEVNQEVEELRYMTYVVSEESKKYKYIGDGESVKINTPKKNFNNFSFSFENKMTCSSLYDELMHVGDYGTESYTINIITNVIPRFKLETFCERVDVKVKDGISEIGLHFNKQPNKYKPLTKSFVNELDKLKSNCNEYNLNNHEICSSIQQLSFVTFKVEGESDGMFYTFRDLKCLSLEDNKFEYIVKYRPDFYECENLIDKFKSESLEKKYENKSPKSNTAMFEIPKNVKSYKCSKCGDKIDKILSEVTTEEYGESLCTNCINDEELKKFKKIVDKTE